MDTTLRHEHAPGNMLHAPVLFGVERSEQSVFIQIFVNIRPREQKQKLYQINRVPHRTSLNAEPSGPEGAIHG
jgi:hypothetical protein